MAEPAGGAGPGRDLVYPSIVVAAKTGFRLLGNKITMTGTEHVPRTGGALLAFNHVSYVDFVYGGLAAQPAKRLVRFMAKRELFDYRWTGPLMRSLHHIEVDRADGVASFRRAVDFLAAGEVVGIFPEATISRAMELKDLKTGAVRIAAEAGVPLLPVALWGTQRLMTKDHPRDFSRGTPIRIVVGEPLHPTGDDPVAETAELKVAMDRALDTAIETYADAHLHPGAWWVPASRGGSAPSLAEAELLDVAEKRARAERRRRSS
ncbi:lysophospholipid acyltransferase family protein [Nocardioides bigeumensis]|uniref:Lysophospholipid acyltransferase family protein n=1 Tax=Nocardioides bigeumensis TaxID=433657 RepID=A0ABP5KR67_9ACTN